MKFLVMSDSHGSINEIDVVLDRHKDIELIFHCGDVDYKKNEIDKRNIKCVNGNAFRDRYFEDELFLIIEDKKFLVTHGHKYFVKSGLSRIKDAVKNADIDFCLFGHTHEMHFEKYGKALIINPGSIRTPHNPFYEASYCLYDNGITKFYNLDGDILKEFA